MKRFTTALLAAAMALPVALPTAAGAQRHGGHWHTGGRNDYRWNGDRNSNWNPAQHYHAGNYRARRLGRNDRIYRGSDGRYYCRRNDGTTGLVIGAIGGGLLGNAIGGDTLSTLLGGAGGALLGRSIDRGNVTCR